MKIETIDFEDFPWIVYSMVENLIWAEPNDSAVIPQMTGLGWRNLEYFKKDMVSKSSIHYIMEPKCLDEGESQWSVSVEYDTKVDRITCAIFRFYGEKRNSYLEIVTNLGYEPVDSFMLEDKWVYFETPLGVNVMIAGVEVFNWRNGERPANVLKDALGIKSGTVPEIFSRYTQIKKKEHLTTVVNKKILFDLLQNFGDKNKGVAVEDEQEVDEYIEYSASLRKYARLINEDVNFRIDPSLLSQVMRELIKWCNVKEQAEKYDKNSSDYLNTILQESIPNLVFMGEPGTGKTTLAKRIAENILGAEFYCITGADLKGQYVGHTKATVVNRFIELRNRTGSESKPAILFIDEAYNLFNNQDEFGAEAIEVLLKAMEPGKRTLKSSSVEKNNSSQMNQEVTLYGNTAVWLGGYEKDMRKALSVNRGMYRRVKTITLPIPDMDSLWSGFQRIMNQENTLLDKEVQKDNWELCTKKADLIREYFVWARSKTYAEFFGNYAGVFKLAEEIIKSTLLKGSALDELNRDIEDIIEQQKLEILTQYQQVIESKYDRLPFMAYTEIKETFADYIGAEGAKDKLKHVIDLICSPEKFPNCETIKGALLMGSAGTGKTFLARCMAGELRKVVREKNLRKDVAFIKVAAAELRSTELVKVLFASSQSYDYVIIFIDEIDAIGRKREYLSDASVLLQLLNEMDGFEGRNNVFVLATTNSPESLDDALRRPGRFDMNIEIGYPNDEERHKIVKHYIGYRNFSDEFISKIVKHFRGYSPVEIKTILNDALILYYDCENSLPDANTIKARYAHRMVRDNTVIEKSMESITLEDGTEVLVSDGTMNENLFFMDFIEVMAQRAVGERSVLDLDNKKFSVEKNDLGLSAVAIHEVGHALVYIMHECAFEKITILKRGQTLGYVKTDVDVRMITKQDFINKLDICFGGRAAEEIIFGPQNVSSGSSSDIQNASELARYMIMQVGMNDKVGPVALESPSARYLGGANNRLCTESTMYMAEDELRKLLKERYSATVEMLKPYSEIMKKLAEYVYEKEEVSGAEFVQVFEEFKTQK